VIWDRGNSGMGSLKASFRGDDRPVVCVSWQQAEEYSRWVGGRLPTEAEWEYAARSGGKVREHPWGSQDATCDRAVLNMSGDAHGCGLNSTWPVCSKPAGNTEHGLCDMIGNATEWVSDWFGSYSASSSTNPTGAASGNDRVIRGISWHDGAGRVPVSIRYGMWPNVKCNYIGFRPVRTVR
jgi:formylglycine-generating enzyme required for sulfatase activity